MENGAVSDTKDPAAFLSDTTGASVTVKLNSGIVYKGELQSVDGYMNIALEKCQELVNGKLRRSYGDAFIRGNNGMSCPDEGNRILYLTPSSALHFERVIHRSGSVKTQLYTKWSMRPVRTRAPPSIQ